MSRRCSAPTHAMLFAAVHWPQSERSAEQIRQCAGDDVEWTQFLQLLHRHRVAALAAHTTRPIRDAMPRAISDALDAAARDGARRGLTLAAETLRVNAMLGRAGIKPVLLKGVTTAVRVYGSVGLRDSRDIDVMVRYDEIEPAHHALLAAGYRLINPPRNLDAAERAAWVHKDKHFGYQHPTTGQQLEVHWRVSANRHVNLSLHDGPIDRVSLGGVSVRAPAAEALLLYLCIHGADHAWCRLKWLADVAALVARASADDLDTLLASARDVGLTRAVGQALLLAERLLDAPVPSAIRLTLGADPTVERLVRIATAAMLDGGVSEPQDTAFGSTRIAFSRFLLRDDWRFRTEELALRLTATPNGHGWTAKPWLRGLYAAAHPIAWAANRARRLAHPRISRWNRESVTPPMS